VKPGELERDLSRLTEAARSARERLGVLEQELAQLRHEMESLAAHPDTRREVDTGALSPLDAHGMARRDRVETPARGEGDRSGREVGSE
jgi:hypothetical protein